MQEKKAKKPRRKIAILGGGMGAIATAASLTDKPGWEEDYEVTIYQLGWRLGGKAASGRAQHDRIHEHGLHLLYGFYENVFALMHRAYEELDRSDDQPFTRFAAPTPEEEAQYPDKYAMHRHHYFTLRKRLGDKYITHVLRFPPNDGVPGIGHPGRDFRHFLQLAGHWVSKAQEKADFFMRPGTNEKPSWWNRFRRWLRYAPVTVAVGWEVFLASSGNLYAATTALKLLENMGARSFRPFRAYLYGFIVKRLEEHLRSLWHAIKDLIESDPEAYATWTTQDYLFTQICGILKDNVLQEGFDKLNEVEFTDWFMSHSPVPEGSRHTITSSWVQGAYDACFAFLPEPGTSPEERKPWVGFEAGTMLKGALRLGIGYKGAVCWMFQAGTGDIIFAPLYEMLRRRGVQFKFFHQVTQLGISDGAVDRIHINRQATPTGEYNPLITVRGLPCWPSTPLFDQLVEGDELKQRAVDLESQYSDWSPVESITLRRGVDFDDVVYAIPLPASASICRVLIAENHRWQAMVQHLKTTRTVAFQLWLTKSSDELCGSEEKENANLGVQPFNTWGDMSQLIRSENWPTTAQPQKLAYFCGPVEDDPNEGNDPDLGSDYPHKQSAVARRAAIEFLKEDLHKFWHNIGPDHSFDWELIVGPDRLKGEERFLSQHWIMNIEPSERYVLSVPGSTKYRIKAGESGFANLYLAGDWTWTGLNSGSLEAAVMSGMQASRALTGFPAVVHGEEDFRRILSWK